MLLKEDGEENRQSQRVIQAELLQKGEAARAKTHFLDKSHDSVLLEHRPKEGDLRALREDPGSLYKIVRAGKGLASEESSAKLQSTEASGAVGAKVHLYSRVSFLSPAFAAAPPPKLSSAAARKHTGSTPRNKDSLQAQKTFDLPRQPRRNSRPATQHNSSDNLGHSASKMNFSSPKNQQLDSNHFKKLSDQTLKVRSPDRAHRRDQKENRPENRHPGCDAAPQLLDPGPV